MRLVRGYPVGSRVRATARQISDRNQTVAAKRGASGPPAVAQRVGPGIVLPLRGRWLGCLAGHRRAAGSQAGLTRLRRFSGWPAWMRPRAIASMIVKPIVMRSRILVSPRMNGWSNPYPPANRLLTRSTALRS